MFYIGLPVRNFHLLKLFNAVCSNHLNFFKNQVARKKILSIILKDENLADDVDLNEIAQRSSDFSGSDLHELCRCAAMNSFLGHIKQVNGNSEEEANSKQQENIYIARADFEVGFQKMSVKSLSTIKSNFKSLFEEGRMD